MWSWQKPTKSLSRCLDPAWTSCTAIFKSAREPGGRQRPRGGGTEHTGQTVLLPWKLVWNYLRLKGKQALCGGNTPHCVSDGIVKWELIDLGFVQVTKRTVVSWCGLNRRLCVIVPDVHLKTECCCNKTTITMSAIVFTQSRVWCEDGKIHRHEVQLRLQKSSCLKRLPICCPSVGWKWFLCVRWTLNGVAEMQSTPLWS